jgi:hypothetical protein
MASSTHLQVDKILSAIILTDKNDGEYNQITKFGGEQAEWYKCGSKTLGLSKLEGIKQGHMNV